MAKPVILRYQSSVASFSPLKVDRTKLYGQRQRIAVDVKGGLCKRASLTADGSQLIRPGMTAQGYFSSEGSPISRAEMVGLDSLGNVVELKPSTLGVEQELIGPVSASEILDIELESVFWLDPLELPDAIAASLRAGDIFKCSFNFSAGLEMETAFVLANPEGIFALVGKVVEPRWVEEGAVFLAEPEEDEDELDFESL